MKRKRIFWIILAVILVAAAVGGFFWFRGRDGEEEIAEEDILRTAEVVRDTLELTVAASGNVVVNRRAELSFESPGTVTEIEVEVGDLVQRGTTLARLEDDPLVDAVHQAELTLAQAELNVETALEPVDAEEIRLARLAIQEASQAMVVAKASEELARARANREIVRAQEIAEDAEDAYESYLDILDDYGLPEAYAAGVTAAYMEAQGNVGTTQVKNEHAIQQAESQWSAAYQRYQQATRNLESLQEGVAAEQLKRLELQREQARLNLEQAQADLSSAVLTAPFDGLIAQVNIQEGALAPSGAPAVLLLDTTTYYVELTVDEIDIGLIETSQDVEITLDAYPDVTLPGVIDRIATLPDQSGNIIVYPVRVRLTNTDQVDIRDGMTASAAIQVAQRENILLVPSWAVRTDQTSADTYTYCYCLENGEPRRVRIEIGERNETYTEVVSGLEEGQIVALVTETRNLLELQGPPSDGRP